MSARLGWGFVAVDGAAVQVGESLSTDGRRPARGATMPDSGTGRKGIRAVDSREAAGHAFHRRRLLGVRSSSTEVVRGRVTPYRIWRTLGRMKLRTTTILLLGLAAVSGGCSPDDNPVASMPQPDSVARYTVTFTATWSATTHPQDFPASAHFSGLIGATHDDRVTFWVSGAQASRGIQDMAELGSKTPLDTEVSTAISAGTAQDTLSGGAVARSPGSVSLDFEIAVSHPRVTLVTMVAPSPDWFVGVAGLPLLVNDGWVDSLVVDLRGWDAGTDDGTTYIAMNAPSMPHVPVAALEEGIFKVNGVVPILGTFTFVRR